MATPVSRDRSVLLDIGAFVVVAAAAVSALVTDRRGRERQDPAPPHAPAPDPSPEVEAPGGKLAQAVARVDRYQQRHSWLGLPIGVVKKFGDDEGGRLAALVAYYGFLSLFPLLLAFVSILGFVLADRPDLQKDLIDSAFGQFPVIGDELRRNVGSITGNTFALVVGIVGALWAGMAAMQAAQVTMNEVHEIPYLERPNFLKSRLRSVAGLLVLGLLLVATTALSGVTSSLGGLPGAARIALFMGTVAADAAVFLLSFQVLTAKHQPWASLVPGALLAGLCYFALQMVGGAYLNHVVSGATATYGAFAVVIGLLAWLFLLAQLTTYAAELNVVLAQRLWPRSLRRERLRRADRRVLRSIASRQQRVPQQGITVEFGPATRLPPEDATP